MSRPDGAPLKLTLLRARRAAPDDLRPALERNGIRIVGEETIASYTSGLRWNAEPVDALLLDLERADDAELDLLDRLLERVALPMVFHDGSARTADVAWLQRLVAKIRTTAAAPAPAARAPEPLRNPPLRCWVLGASFGGPEALKRFLGAFAAPPSAALIIGQHIGDGFVEVLAAQLTRATCFKVQPAADGSELEPGRVYVAPVRQRLRIDAARRIRLEDEGERHTYMPSIDRLMEEVARRFGKRSGAIVFSGMGDDGTRGAVAIARAGGTVWAQDSASCAIDSMPNCARATGAVTHSGSPEALAAALAEHLATTAPATASRTA